MNECFRPNPPPRCRHTSTPSRFEENETPYEDDTNNETSNETNNTTVIALSVVVTIIALVLIVVLGIIIYRRMRSQKAKATSEPPVHIHDQFDNVEKGNTNNKECKTKEGVVKHSEQLYSTIEENKADESVYNSLDDYELTRSHGYEQVTVTEGHSDITAKNSIDTTYNKLNDHGEEDKSSQDYSHARVVDSTPEGTLKDGGLEGEDNDGYDRLCNKTKKPEVYDSDADYDHIDKNGETISSSL